MAGAPPSNDDRDRWLAERIGALRERATPLDTSELSDDEVVRALLAYRGAHDPSPTAEQSDQMWAAIEAETAPEPVSERATAESATTRIFTLPVALRWAVAASLIVAVGLAWFYLARAPEPVQVAAAEQSIQTYTTPEGSVVRLRPHSALYRVPAEGERRYRLTGEGFFEVVAHPDEPFIVEAGALRVQVLSTRFNVHTWGRPAVFLEEGRVQLTHTSSAETVTLAPGQRSGLAESEDLMAPAAADGAEAVDWLRQEMVFTERPVPEIVAELEHHYGIPIELPAAMRGETLSGRILLQDRQQSLDDLAVVLGGRFTHTGPQAYRFRPGESE